MQHGQAPPFIFYPQVMVKTYFQLFWSMQDPGFVELAGIFGVRNIVDEHHDMRLDIDGMSYEVNEFCGLWGFLHCNELNLKSFTLLESCSV